MNNPFDPNALPVARPAAPPGYGYAPPPQPRESVADLRAVARYQRVLILCVLAQLAIGIGLIASFVVFRVGGEWWVMLGALAAITLVSLVAVTFIFLMAQKVMGTGPAVLMAVLSLVTGMGFVILIIVNVLATSMLQRNGVRVGLIGASGADLDALERRGG